MFLLSSSSKQKEEKKFLEKKLPFRGQTPDAEKFFFCTLVHEKKKVASARGELQSAFFFEKFLLTNFSKFFLLHAALA